MNTFTVAIPVTAALLAAALVFVVWVITRKRIAEQTLGRAQEQAARLIRKAERDVGTRTKEAELLAKERAHALLQESERQTRKRQEELASIQQQLSHRTQELTGHDREAKQRDATLQERETRAAEQERTLTERVKRCEELTHEYQQALQRVSGLTGDEAKELVVKQIEQDARRDAANLVKRLETEARESADAKAKQIITQAIQRSAPEHAIEATVSVVALPSDDLKGRIIGREGRNIRALEQATGVELIVDDTPGAIILSSFDPFRREVAKRAIEQLVADGRIHPARIEEVVEKVKAELDEHVLKEG